MDSKQAHDLFMAYVDGWQAGDVDKLTSPFATSATLRESHGPSYANRDEIRAWAQGFVDDGGKVDSWDVTHHHAGENAATFEWDFAYSWGDESGSFSGVTVVEYSDGKISAMREYRLTDGW